MDGELFGSGSSNLIAMSDGSTRFPVKFPADEEKAENELLVVTVTVDGEALAWPSPARLIPPVQLWLVGILAPEVLADLDFLFWSERPSR